MRNSHLRVGTLQFKKTMRDTSIDLSVKLDRLIAETAASDGAASACHLLSVIGGDQEIAAIAAAIADNARFYVSGAGVRRTMITMGSNVETCRSSITIPGRKRPVRHLVAISGELAKTRAGGDPKARRTIVCDDAPWFVLHRLGVRFGLPVVPEWSDWFEGLLVRSKAVENLIGIGCQPIAVKGTKKRFLGWIGHGLKRGSIKIPEDSSNREWKLPSWFTSNLEETSTDAIETSRVGDYRDSTTHTTREPSR